MSVANGPPERMEENLGPKERLPSGGSRSTVNLETGEVGQEEDVAAWDGEWG